MADNNSNSVAVVAIVILVIAALGIGYYFMAGTQTRIGLWSPQLGIASGRGGLHVHYAMHIDSNDFDGAVARLRKHGYDPEIVSFDDDDRGKSLYVTDPDGNVVECWTWDVKGHLAG